MTDLKDPKLHRHGKALIHMEQDGEDIKVSVHGHKDDLLHMLMAIIKRKNYPLARLLEKAVLLVTKEHFEFKLAAHIKGLSKEKERKVN